MNNKKHLARAKAAAVASLAARRLKMIEGREFTLCLHMNSQESVEITDASQVPIACRELDLCAPGCIWQVVLAHLPEDSSKVLTSCIRDDRPCSDAIKEAASRFEEVPSAHVKRGVHLRVACYTFILPESYAQGKRRSFGRGGPVASETSISGTPSESPTNLDLRITCVPSVCPITARRRLMARVKDYSY